jgi:hypothetical protein
LKQDKIKITILATGCGTKILPAGSRKKTLNIAKSKPRKTLPEQKPEKTKRKTEPSLQKSTSLIKKPLKLLELKQKIKFFKKAKRKPKKIEKKHPQKTEKATVPLSESAIEKQKTEDSNQLPAPKKVEVKIRRNALQIKEAIVAEEQDLIDQEKKWETPAFLRRK